MAMRYLSVQMQEYYIRRLREVYAARRQRIAAIRTKAAAVEYRDHVRRALRRCFRPLPARKTPLNAGTHKVTDFGEYRMEHVTFESRPGFRVTANLYLPAGAKGRSPGVLFPCGHSSNGKAYPPYVTVCIRLVREGYAVLIYDPLNQGERDIYSLLDQKDRPTRESCCVGHNIVGKQMAAAGDWFGCWRVWDGIRAADFLAGRPEVDPGRLAVTGQSGGGTLSAYLWAMDSRFKAVASSCWTTSYLNDIESATPADDEQYPPGMMAEALDKIDLFISRSPAAALLLGQKYDFFDDRGLRSGYAELLRIHRLLGGEPRFCSLSVDTEWHKYSDGNQFEMLRFFNSVMGKGRPAADRPVEIPDEPRLQVTPECDVNKAGSRPIYELVSEEAGRVTAARRVVPPAKLAGVIRNALCLRVPRKAPYVRRTFNVTLPLEATKRRAFRFLLEVEPGVLCPLWHVAADQNFYRPTPVETVTLYLPNLCTQFELEKGTVAVQGPEFWSFDPRGLGEGLAGEDDVLHAYGIDYMLAGHALMFRETLLGARLFDVLSAVKLLRAEGAKEVHVAGRGQGAILALLAGVMDAAIRSVRAVGAPESIQKMVETPLSYWPAANFPRGVLAHFDLPDVRRALGRRLAEDIVGDPGRFEP